MKMIGLTQRLPYPGKRGLRRDVAEKDVEAAENNLQEAVNRVQREVKMAYFDLGQVDEMQRLVEKNRRILEQFLSIAETRYGVGQASQADVLKAQTQLSRMLDELIKLERERPMIEAELNRALGRPPGVAALAPQPLRPREVVVQLAELRDAARQSRPQLLAQQSMIARSTKQLDLARKDYYPDFDVRFSYGQRDNTVEMKREDMISFTVAINLPVWRASKLEPRVSEAQAMREQASRMYQARLNEIDAMLRREVANAEQSLKSARLYETGILPQARLAVEAALSAYRVGRTDFLMLLDSQMTVFNYEQSYIANVASQNKALAEIEFLTGRTLF
jgi:cobalt-zinc-cadmium efflux system outer membrane protein